MKNINLFITLSIFFTSSFILADEFVEDTKYKIFESFDKLTDDGSGENHRWVVIGSKFSTEGFPKLALAPFAEPIADTSEGNNSLGIKGSFDRPGFNYIEIIPVENDNDANGNPVPKLLNIPGIASKMDIWVWCAGYDYDLKAEFIDYTGKLYVVDVGNLKYKGWKLFKFSVPNVKRIRYIPDSNLAQIKFSKFVIWTNSGEKVTWVSPGVKDKPAEVGFYVYLDQFRLFTDEYISKYPGQELTDPKNIEKIWKDTN